MASYLGRHVNLALLIIIIGVIVAMVGTTVFFQRSLQNRTSAYEDTTQTLSQCQTSLANFQDKYESAQQKVTEVSEDIGKYDIIYEQKVAELSDAQDQLADRERQLAFEKLQKERFQTMYEGALRQNKDLNATIRSKDSLISSLRSDVSDLEDRVAACGG